MAVAQRYLSPTNTHLPVATGTVIGFIRDPAKFKMNEYCQFVETPSVTGLYYRLDHDHPARIVSKAEFDWAPGADAPQGHTNLGGFDMVGFTVERLAFPFNLDEVAVEQAREFAKWDPLEYEAKAMATQAMTLRVMDVWTAGGTLNLDNPSNWPAASTATAATLSGNGGGTWANSTAALQTIYRSLMAAAQAINLNTNGTVDPNDLVLVISPAAAIAMRASAEIVDFVKQQGSAPEILMKGWTGNPNWLWGLPPNLYGIKLVVESTPYVSTLPVVGGNVVTAGTRAYAKADNYAALLTRPGGVDAPFGSRSFGTLQCYWHKYDMAVEARFDSWNKKHDGRVVDYRTFITPAIVTGYLIQNILT